MSDCLFCSIVAGDIPVRQVYADEAAVAFLDIAPLKRGHTLVVSRRHVANALADATVLASLAPAITAVGALLTERLGADGMNIVTNVNEVAGQSVFHLHIHLVPRYADDQGFRALVEPSPADDAAEVAAALRG